MPRIPKSTGDDCVVRLPADLVVLLDGWRALQRERTAGLELSRPEAVRTILRAEFDRAFEVVSELPPSG